MHPDPVLSIERPDPKLMTYYGIVSVLFPPFSLVALPILYFRYHTMRYRFDDEGVSMSWGILFRREVNLTYARIQDIHVTSGIIQRWLGLADLHIQTASGSATAEMKIEGILQYAAVRDFLYTKMRGYRDRMSRGRGGVVAATPWTAVSSVAAAGVAGAADAELAALLLEIRDEMRQARQALEAAAGGTGSGGR